MKTTKEIKARLSEYDSNILARQAENYQLTPEQLTTLIVRCHLTRRIIGAEFGLADLKYLREVGL